MQNPGAGRDPFMRFQLGLFTIVKVDGLCRHDGRDCMFVDKLRLAVTAQEHTEIVKPGDHALQLYAVDQEDCDRDFGFPGVVQKGVLQVLFVGSHVWLPFIIVPLSGIPVI
jgi:hypothetical protein